MGIEPENPVEETETRGGGLKGVSGGKLRRRRVWVPLIVLLALVISLLAADYLLNAGEIYGGVRVGTVDVGGMTPAQARETVRERVTGPLEDIRLSGPQTFSRSAHKMGVSFKVKATVDQAYAVGRSGNFFERVADRVRASYGTVEISPGVDYRPEKARSVVEDIAAELNRGPRDASISIDGASVEVVDSRDGYKTNVEATMKNVHGAVKNMTGKVSIVGDTTEPAVYSRAAVQAAERARAAMSGPLIFTAQGEQWELAPAQVGEMLDIRRDGGDIRVSLDREGLRNGLADLYAHLTVEAVEADFVVRGSTVAVTPGHNGQSIRDEEFLDSIEAGIFTGDHEYQVPVSVEVPELTTAEAERLKPTQIIGEYSTNYLTYDDSEGRVTNLNRAAEAVNNTILAPGETFSFNELAAPLDYESTKVILNGKVDRADGGGLCQVSSTLYMAANYAGLDVFERHPHYAELPYIRPGFDATVWFGRYGGGELDMQFRNTADSYVLIREWVDTTTGDVHAEIWGQPTGRTVKMRSRKVSEEKDSEGHEVTRWITYQTVTENGRVIQDGVLHKDEYRELEEESDSQSDSSD